MYEEDRLIREHLSVDSQNESATQDDSVRLIDLSANIVAAYVSKNPLSADAVPGFLKRLHATMVEMKSGQIEARPTDQEPAVPIGESVQYDFIVCLEDGKRLRSLRRHLKKTYQMTPQEYRKKWGLPDDYPMVAPEYSELRSKLAKQMGLGKSK